MNTLIRISKIVCLGTLILWILPALLLVQIQPGELGVRQSNVTGVSNDDLGPGWHWRIPGMHKVFVLPSHYEFLDYSAEGNRDESLQIRTKDNNIVQLDVTVPVRILPGDGNALVRDGNHVRDSSGMYRYQRLATEATVSVLREHLAELDSTGFYTSEQRLRVAEATLAALATSLEELHLEAESVLIRAVRFRGEYENQLQQIQLNEQNKLLDHAREKVADQQQELDNYQQGTNAQAASREQEWIKREADLERAYQIGFLESADDLALGASRRTLVALPEDKKLALREAAAKVLGIPDPAEVSDDYLLGIKNIEAETREYSKRVAAEANGIEARLKAEGDALVAKVRGEFETKVNALLGSSAGRAYVAWKSADNITFDKELVFRSSDGIPAVLQLRRFAEQFMGK